MAYFMAISNSKMVWLSWDTDVIFLSSVLIIRVNGEEVRLMLWDTAGQEEFDAITKAYYRGKGKKTWMQKQIRFLLLFKKNAYLGYFWEFNEYIFGDWGGGGLVQWAKLSWKELTPWNIINVQ